MCSGSCVLIQVGGKDLEKTGGNPIAFAKKIGELVLELDAANQSWVSDPPSALPLSGAFAGLRWDDAEGVDHVRPPVPVALGKSRLCDQLQHAVLAEPHNMCNECCACQDV